MLDDLLKKLAIRLRPLRRWAHTLDPNGAGGPGPVRPPPPPAPQ